MGEKILQAEKDIHVRFSEVDAMGVVWHGSYLLYLEDAREVFGRQYQLEYLTMYQHDHVAPIVDLKLQYRSALHYQDQAKIVITYQDSDAAKLIFDYKIYNLTTRQLAVIAHTEQVFVGTNGELQITWPAFMIEWKKNHGLL